MISPAKLDKLPSDMVNLIQDLQNDIIRDVCRRLSKANYLTPTAEWQLYKANQLQLSYNEVNRRIARFLKVRERDIQRLYTDTVKQALKEDGDIYRMAAAMGKLPPDTGEKIQNYFRSAAFSRLLSKGLKNCKNGVRNLCNSMAAQVNSDLSYAMDYAHIQVLSGAFSYSEAIYNAVKRLTEGGLTRVEYPSGRRDNVDVCVRRAVLSSVNKSCCDLQLDLAREVGSKYVEVTAHIGARPSHALWQGQIYSLVKGDDKYPYFYDATGYGTGDGLGGWNCRHNFFPYFPGIDTPYHSPEFTRTENNEYYALTQRQRAMERAVRSSKRELAALDGARSGTDDPGVRARLDNEFARKSVTLKNREKRLDEFIKDKGLARENDRTWVVGFGHSVSGKAAWANKKAAHPNLAKAVDVFDNSLLNNKSNISPEGIIEELLTSPIGTETLEYLERTGIKPKLISAPRYDGVRGDQLGTEIRIFLSNTKNTRIAAQTIIHEVTHQRYGIEKCQWAEAVCMAKEKMHIMKRNYLTFDEKKYIVRLAREAYPEYKWKKGGRINGRKL